MSESGTDLRSLAFVLASRSAVVFCVYAAGSWGLSPAWLLVPLLLSLLREKKRRQRLLRRRLTQALASGGEQDLLAQIQNLPSWVQFPDVERAEWLNKVLAQLWPSLGRYLADLLMVQSKQQLAQLLAQYKLSNFKFDNVDLGIMSPRIGGIKVYVDNVHRSEMIIDMEVFYAGDCVVQCSFNYLSVGIKNISLHGNLRLVCKPLIPTMPLVGAVQLFFLSTPDFDFDLLGVADVLDVPGVSEMLRNTVISVVNSQFVLPNHMQVVLSAEAMSSMRGVTLPKGFLRLHVIEAKQLIAKDSNLFGKNSSDPYAVVHVGNGTFQTRYIEETLDPVWNFVCETGLSIVQGSVANIELWDWDRSSLDKDDKLGRCSVDLSDIVDTSTRDIWVPLDGVSTGSVHLRLQWFSFSANPDDLQKQLDLNATVDNDGPNELNSAVLGVFVDSAEQLPLVKNASREPSPRVRLTVGRTTKVTAVKSSTREPVFEENLVFPVVNPLVQVLAVQVEDHATDQILGRLELPLQDLLKAVDMKTTNTKYYLNAVESPAQLIMSLQLAVFTPDRVESTDGLSEQARPDQSQETPVSLPNKIGLKPQSNDNKVQSDVDHSTITSDSNMNRLSSNASLKVSEAQSTQEKGAGDHLSTKEAPEVAELVSKSQVERSSVGAAKRQSFNDSGAYQLGRIQISLKFQEPDTLSIGIHQISGLLLESDSPDLYVKSYLLPDRSESSKRKTKMLKASINPVYDEVFVYSISADEVTSRTLEIQVVLNKWFAANPIHGMLHLDLPTIASLDGKHQWLDLRPPATFNT